MHPALSRTEAGDVLDALKSMLSPNDLVLLLRLCGGLDAATHDMGMDRALALLYPEHDHKRATDALGKLRRRLDGAAEEAGVRLSLKVRGAKKSGAAGRWLSFEGQPLLPSPPMPALELTRGRFVPDARAVPEGGAVALLVTVNEHETQAVLSAFLAPDEHPLTESKGRHVYQDLGRHGDFRVVHMTCEMGATGPGSATTRVKDGIQHWSPAVVIGVGIAFGARQGEQQMGDVLVSRQVLNYEKARIGTGRAKNKQVKITSRGDKATASTEWLDRLRQIDATCRHAGGNGWPRLQLGLLLSGEKLVDHLDYRESLKAIADGQAIGGEMEGTGIYSAAAEERCGWLVVKAISDWADGSKSGASPEAKVLAERWQRQAADNAALVVRAAITQSPPPELGQRLCRVDHEVPEPAYREAKDLANRFIGLRAAATRLDKVILSTPGLSTAPARDDDATVHVLDYLKRWLDRDDGAPLFALLGEYGMGKTVTCQRLSRDLNQRHNAGQGGRPSLYFDLRALQNQRGHVPTLSEVLQELIARDYRNARGDPSLTPARVHELHDQGALVIFDGLDEVLVHHDAGPGQAFTRELLSLQRRGAKGRVLVTCRTHFFRTLRDQATHLTGEDRGDKEATAYEALTLLPFAPDQIRQYLRQTVPGVDEGRLLETIKAVHNLSELAERPYTLSLIAQFLPELERLRAAGTSVYGVTLYRSMVRSWLERDQGKHHLKPDHKMRLATDLAAELWRRGQRTMPVAELETWFSRWLRSDDDMKHRYAQLSPDKLDEDLRNSTFLVRDDSADGGGAFRFAHTSMQEFFVATQLLQALQANDPGTWQMPRPSVETLDFLGQMLAERADAGDAEPLATLSGWRGGYRHQASELLLVYALRAQLLGWPVPALSQSDFCGADLGGVTFDAGYAGQPLDLRGSRFDGANLRETVFVRVALDGSSWVDTALAGSQFLQCTLTDSDLGRTDLSGAVLRACDLHNVKFDGAQTHGLQLMWCTRISDTPAGALLAPRPGVVRHRQMLALSNSFARWLACAFSPDGLTIISAAENGIVRLWDTRSGQALGTLQGHQGSVLSCAFSPDGLSIVSAGVDGTVRLWDARLGRALRTLKGHLAGVRSCAFSPDGLSIVSAGDDSTVRIWDTRSGRELRTLEGHLAGVRSCAFSPDGLSIASAGFEGTIYLWDARSGHVLRVLQDDHGALASCAFSPDGLSIVSAGDDGTVQLWDARLGEVRRTLAEHQSSVQSCAFSPDGLTIASAGSDGTVRLWDARSGQALRVMQGHRSWAQACAFSPDGLNIVSVGFDGALRLWDAGSGRVLRTLKGQRRRGEACAFSPDGLSITSVDFTGTVHQWDARSGQALRTLLGYWRWVHTCAFSPDGLSIISAGDDGSVRLWDARSGQTLRTLLGHKDAVSSCAFSPDGLSIVSAGEDATVRLWDARSGQALRTLHGHHGAVTSCAFSPDGLSIVSAGEDGFVRLWDARSGQALHTLEGHRRDVLCCSFSPDGLSIVSAGADHAVRLWDARSGQALHTLKGHLDWVRTCTFSPDGLSIVSAGDDATVRLWDARSGQGLHTLQGHLDWVRYCAFSPDGLSIVSTGDDGTVRLWDARSGQGLFVCWSGLDAHLVWNPASGAITEGSGDVWRAFGWEDTGADGRPVLLPVETFGRVPPPLRLAPPAPDTTDDLKA